MNLRDGTSRVLFDVVVRNDSIIGIANRKARTRFAYSRDQVMGIERGETDKRRTAIVPIAIPAAVLLIGAYIVAAYGTS